MSEIMSLSTLIGVLIIIWSHYIGDFVMQLDQMARNKSKCNKALRSHIYWYTATLFVGAVFLFNNTNNITTAISMASVFAVVNGVVHFYIDYVTSRVGSKKYAAGQLGSTKFPNFGFYSVIGLDQALHYTVLFITYYFLVNL